MEMKHDSDATAPRTSMSTNDLILRPIASLVPGPNRVRFQGVVVNIYSRYTYESDLLGLLPGKSTKASEAAKGCLKMLLWDASAGGGEILVKLWLSHTTQYQDIVLGSRLTITTTHVSSMVTPGMTAEKLRTLPASLTVSIFPDRDAGCALTVEPEQESDDQNDGSDKQLLRNVSGLMDLDAFINGAAQDRTEAVVKLLVSVIQVGEIKTISTRAGPTFQVLPVTVADQSCLRLPNTITTERGSQLVSNGATVDTCELSLSPSLYDSIGRMKSNEILLLTQPRLLSTTHRRLKLSSRSQIHRHPFQYLEAIELSRWKHRLFLNHVTVIAAVERYVKSIMKAEDERAQRYVKRVKLGPDPFSFVRPQPPERRQFTLSLFVNQISLQPEQPFHDYVSVIITRVGLVDLFDHGRLFHGNCNCGRIVHSSRTHDQCPDCCVANTLSDGEEAPGEIRVGLRFNSLLLAGFSDECGGLLAGASGQDANEIQHHNLVLTDQAVERLTGLNSRMFNPSALSGSLCPSGGCQICKDQPALKSDGNSSAVTIESGTAPCVMRERLLLIESLLTFRRLILKIGWTGESQRDIVGGKVVIFDVVS